MSRLTIFFLKQAKEVVCINSTKSCGCGRVVSFNIRKLFKGLGEPIGIELLKQLKNEATTMGCTDAKMRINGVQLNGWHIAIDKMPSDVQDLALGYYHINYHNY